MCTKQTQKYKNKEKKGIISVDIFMGENSLKITAYSVRQAQYFIERQNFSQLLRDA